MLKSIFKNPYVIAGIVVFIILLFVGALGFGASWGESLLGSAVLTIVGIGGIWWKREVWP